MGHVITESHGLTDHLCCHDDSPLLCGVPEYHHVGGGLGEGGDGAGDSQQDHEGEEELRAAAATRPRGGEAATSHAPTLSVVLHRHRWRQSPLQAAPVITYTPSTICLQFSSCDQDVLMMSCQSDIITGHICSV